MPAELSSLSLESQSDSDIVSLRLSGKLEKSDYETFVPEMDRLINEHGKLRLRIELVDFHGWTAGALWEDTKFGIRHFNDLKRLAFVGDRKWEKGMAIFCKPFTTAKVRYFDVSERDKADEWLRE